MSIYHVQTFQGFQMGIINDNWVICIITTYIKISQLSKAWEVNYFTYKCGHCPVYFKYPQSLLVVTVCCSTCAGRPDGLSFAVPGITVCPRCKGSLSLSLRQAATQLADSLQGHSCGWENKHLIALILYRNSSGVNHASWEQQIPLANSLLAAAEHPPASRPRAVQGGVQKQGCLSQANLKGWPSARACACASVSMCSWVLVRVHLSVFVKVWSVSLTDQPSWWINPSQGDFSV